MAKVDFNSRMEFRREGRLLKVTLAGSLSETSDYSNLRFDDLDAVDIDLEGITRVNSAGILLWTRMLKAIPKAVRVTLWRCSVIVMHQVQIFPLFLDRGRIKVKSFFVEYDCDGCAGEASVLIDASEVDGDGVYPTKPCSRCGLPMKVINSRRAAFLSRGE